MAKRRVPPHKGEQARPGIGSSLRNAQTIANMEKPPKGSKSKCGVAPTYFANSRAVDAED